MGDSEMERRFKEEFGIEAEVWVKVPGRVNIIGEHIDYNGFPVLPMALERCITVVAARYNADPNAVGDYVPSLRLANTDPLHATYVKPLMPNLSIDYGKDGWGAYFACGVRGALESLDRKGESKIEDGMHALIEGTVPSGAGLSSSSALVCSAFLSAATLYQLDVSMKEAAGLCASCERYIGTEGGGMDQAIALLATPGCAKLVEFEPELTTVGVQLPEDAVFVVAHSQITKNKAASSEFNTRVAECRIAAQLLSKYAGLEWKSIKKLKHVVDKLDMTLDEAIAMVSQHLTKPNYSKHQICEELDVSMDEMEDLCLSPNTKHIDSFKLAQRAAHVYQEAGRVYEWKKAAENGDMVKMGNLMCESHSSLKDLYECSHSKVDSLVQICMSVGALGARITGAGWGGCVVALITKGQVDDFISRVKTEFYGTNDCDDLIFPTYPSGGAQVIKL